MRIRSHRAVAAAAAAAIALTSVAFTPAVAAPASKQQSVAAFQSTDFSSRRRAPRHRAADRAVLGAVAGLFGTIAVLAARDRYERHYGYGYYGGPYYARPYYGPAPYAYRYRPYYPY
jgi:nicotinic acid phosphoribosyltransferase